MDENKIFDVVRRNLGAVVYGLDTMPVRLDDTLAGLGCNSVDRAEVMTMTMQDLGISVPVMEFQNAVDIRSLVTLLRKHAG